MCACEKGRGRDSARTQKNAIRPTEAWPLIFKSGCRTCINTTGGGDGLLLMSLWLMVSCRDDKTRSTRNGQQETISQQETIDKSWCHFFAKENAHVDRFFLMFNMSHFSDRDMSKTLAEEIGVHFFWNSPYLHCR